MRFANSRQSSWMYGFPTRKHHYDRNFSRRQSSLDRYSAGNSITGDLKFTDGHSVFANHSPVKYNSATNAFSNGAITSSPHKVGSGNGQILSSKYQPAGVMTRNGFIHLDETSADCKEDVGTGIIYPNDNGTNKFHGGSLRKDIFNVTGSSPCNFGTAYDSREDYYHHESPGYYSEIYKPNRWANSPPPDLIENTGYKPKAQVTEPFDVVALPPAKARFDVIKLSSNSCVNNSNSKNSNNTKNSANSFSNSGSCRSSRESSDFKTNECFTTSESILKAVKDENTFTALKMLESRRPNDDINITDASGRTILSYAVLKGNISLLEALLKIPHIDVNKPDNEGNTPLHFAVQAGQMEAVNLLLNCCPNLDVDARNHLGFTALMKAALQGRTKCAKMLLFAGASPTMRDTGRGLRAEQWARLCGRYICADVIEKYARSELLSKSTSCGNWGNDPGMGLHFVNGRLQPPAIALQNAIAQSEQNNGIKSKLKRAFHVSSAIASGNRNCNSHQKLNSFSLVTQLTSAALCVSSPVLPNSSQIPPVVKSILKPFVIPKIEITPDPSDSSENVQSNTSTDSNEDNKSSDQQSIDSGNSARSSTKRRFSFAKLRKK